jgi:hypothetical protein
VQEADVAEDAFVDNGVNCRAIVMSALAQAQDAGA